MPPRHAGAAAPSAAGFPEEIATRFRPVRELDHGSQADVWLVQDDAGVQFVAKVYRPGFEGQRDILEVLHGLEPNRDIVPVVSYGRAGGRLYVVLEYVPGGNLRSLMQPGAPAPTELVREALAQLVAALERLHEAGIEHQDLKPGNVLVRSRAPLDLVLADFGVAAQTSETVRATSLTGMTWAYAPPEAFSLRRDELMLWLHKYDAWSLGVIVVELLTGRHPLPGTEAAIATFFVTRGTDDLVEGVEDPAWRKLCRGLLRRDPEARWGTAEARRWLEAPDALDLYVKDEAAPAHGFRFVGRDYATAADLGSAMASDWAMAEDVWRNRTPELVQWLRNEQGTPEVASRLEEIDRAPDLDLDAQLFWAIHALAPRSQPSFRGQSLAAENLARVASRAAARPDGADAGLLLAVSNMPGLGGIGDPALAAQTTRWSGVEAAWEDLRGQYGELPELSETDRSILLAAATEGSGVTEQLRERTSQVLAKRPRAGKSDWFRRLGAVGSADAPRLRAMALLAGRAHEEVEAELRPHRKTRWLAIGAGAAAGILISLLVLLIEPFITPYFDPVRFGGDATGPIFGGAVAALVGYRLWWKPVAGRYPQAGCCVAAGCVPVFGLVHTIASILLFPVLVSGPAVWFGLFRRIPGPFLVDAGFVTLSCTAIGFGVGAALKRLNRQLTVRTAVLAMLAIMLAVALVTVVIAFSEMASGDFRGILGGPVDGP